MYTNQHVDVAWNNHRSSHFPTSNGVKQGGVLSPTLFGMYRDELLSRLKQSGYGCMVRHLFCGALGYADDVSILAPALYELRRMCDICSDYGLQYNLQFNPAKCKLLNFSQQRDVFFLLTMNMYLLLTANIQNILLAQAPEIPYIKMQRTIL